MDINTTIPSQDNDAVALWPALPYHAWQDTRETLQMWTQIVGKVKLELAPFLNEWWNVAFAVTPRGLTTATIPFGRRIFVVNFDFIDHQLTIQVSDGTTKSVPLIPRSVADFYQEFMAALHALDGAGWRTGTGHRRVLARKRQAADAGLLRLSLPGACGLPGSRHPAGPGVLPSRPE